MKIIRSRNITLEDIVLFSRDKIIVSYKRSSSPWLSNNYSQKMALN